MVVFPEMVVDKHMVQTGCSLVVADPSHIRNILIFKDHGCEPGGKGGGGVVFTAKVLETGKGCPFEICSNQAVVNAVGARVTAQPENDEADILFANSHG